MKKIIDILFIIILCCFTFFGYANFTPSEKIISLSIFIISIAIIILHRVSKIKLTTSTKILFIFCVYCTFSILYTISFEFSIYQLLIFWSLAFMKLSLDNIDVDDVFFKKILQIIYIFGLIHVVSTIIYSLFPSVIQQICSKILTSTGYTYNLNLYKYGCIAGITPDHGINAIFISIFLSIAFYNVLKKYNIKNILLFLLGVTALLLTGKRGPLAANSIAFMIMFLKLNKENKKKIRLFMIFSVLIVTFIVVINAVPDAKFVFERFQNATSANELLNGRSDSYEIMINNFKDHFIIGSGVRSTLTINNNNDGHNIYLQLLSEGGIIGFTIMMVFLIYNFIKTYKNCDGFFKYSSLYYQVFFLIYGLTGNPLYYVPTLIIYLIYTISVNKEKKEIVE